MLELFVISAAPLLALVCMLLCVHVFAHNLPVRHLAGARGQSTRLCYVSQSFSLVEDSDTDPEEEEDGGYDSDVQREKDMDYISKTYAHPARDVTAELKGTKVEKKPATNKR